MDTSYGRGTALERDERSPTTVAKEALYTMADVWGVGLRRPGEDFLRVIFGAFMGNDELAHYDCDEFCNEARTVAATDGPQVLVIASFAIGAAYSASAMKSDSAGRLHRAWTYATDAVWEAAGLSARLGAQVEQRSALGRMGAAARHEEDRALKRDAIEAYLNGSYTSKDAAAEAIAGKVVPAKFRTVRAWLVGLSTGK
ncbi:MAG: hypothetical protein EPN38_10445 [Rhodanobacteraceae bacterium]|nr:MAG: hypothetical protein EPN38_10445 [Rhodanobacteraceae bacterium]